MDPNTRAFEVPLIVEFSITSKNIQEAERIAISSLKRISTGMDVELVGNPVFNIALKIILKVTDVNSIEDAKKIALAKIGKKLPRSRIIVL